VGIGKEVADAYIDVHGDLSKFRQDLDSAGGATAEKAAMRAADDFSDAWNKRITQDVNGKWASIVDAMYSNKQIDWDRLLGEFDAKSFDEAQSKITAFMEDMKKMGKLEQKEFDGAKKALDSQLDSMHELEKAERDRLDRLKQIADKQRFMDAEMESALKEAERLSRTFEGMFKDNKAADMADDFKAMTRAMNDMDWSKFAKGFDNLDDASRRVREINALMHEQGRITDENAAKVQASIDAYIQAEKDAIRAKKDALDETNRLRAAQDKYNKSLDGMVRAANFQRMERDFRMLTDAIASGDWSNLARGSKDMDEMRQRILKSANEMRNLGRMTDAEFRNISTRINDASRNMHAYNISFDRAREGTKRLSVDTTRLKNIFSRLISVTQGLRQHLGGFAGLNVFGDMLESGLEFVHNLDRIAVSASITTMKLASMASVAVAGMAELVAIVGDLGGIIGGLAVLAPSFLVGAAIGVGVLAAALQDTKKVLKDLKPLFAKLQDDISADFWKKAAGPIRDAVKALMPIIDNPKGTSTASSLGTLVGKLATAFKNIPAKKINDMFDRMNRAIDILGDAMAPLVRAFTTLGDVGSKYFERFATWIKTLSDQFDKFIQKSAANGDLDRWINNAIEGFKNIGRSIDGAMGIFNAINDAAKRAGFGGLKSFADSLQRAADIMNSPAFQKTLTTYLEGVRDLALKVGKAIGGLGPAAESFAETAKFAFGKIGDAVARLIGYIGQIFSNPTFQQGVKNFTAGIDEAVRKLEPAVKPFAESLGQALSLFGDIIVAIAEVAAAIAVQWGPVLDSMSRKMQTLVGPMKETLLKIVKDVTPLLAAIDKNIVGPLVTAFKEKLLPAIEGFFDMLGSPVGQSIIENLGKILKPIVEDLLPALFRLATQLLPIIAALLALFTPTVVGLIEAVAGAVDALAGALKTFNEVLAIGQPGNGDWVAEFIGGFLTGNPQEAVGKLFLDFFNGMWAGAEEVLSGEADRRLTELLTKMFPDQAGMIRDIQGFFDDLFSGKVDWGKIASDLWSGFVGGFTGISTENWGKIGEVFTGWIENVRNFFGIHSPSTLMFAMAGDIIQGFINGFAGLGEKIGETWNGVVEWITTKVGEIQTNVGLFIEQFKTNWNNFWGGLGTKVQEVWDGIVLWITTKYTEIQTNIGLFIETVKTNWNAFWDGVWTKVSEIWTTISTWIVTKYTEIQTNIGLFIETVKTNWNTFWDNVKNKVTEIWNAITTWITTKYTEIQTNIQNFITTVRTNWDNFWNTVKNKVTEIWNAITSWISGKVGEIRSNITGFISTVKTNWNSFWDGVKQKVTEAWNNIKTGVQTGIDNVVGFMRDLPGKVTTALGDLGGTLLSAGTSLLQGLWDGMVGKWNEMTGWISGLAGWIAANKGPIEYDRRLLEPAGKAIMDGLDNGLKSRMDPLLNTLQAITDAVTDGVTGDLSKSKMYITGKEAAQGLADGLKANRSAVHTALGTLGAFTVPASQTAITVGGNLGAAAIGRPTVEAPGNHLTIAEGAISITTPTKSPELVAAKVIDSFVNFSSF
jgi:phage-related protein